MKTISAPADLGGAPLSELKQWLAITTSNEDALLIDLLAAAHAMCERFTGLAPYLCDVKEIKAVRSMAIPLGVQPVTAFVEATALGHSFARRTLTSDDYAIETSGDGRTCLVLKVVLPEAQLELHYRAGQSEDWAGIDAGLRHGIIRFAAHQYRERDNGDDTTVPAAVAALWQPYRRMRL